MAADVEPQPLSFGVFLAGIIARWRLALKVLGAVLVFAAIAAVVLPPIYEAKASFVTAPSGKGGLASALATGTGIQGLASQFGVSGASEPSESPNFYVRLMESEELRRRLLKSKFHDPRGKSPRDSATLLDILKIRNDDPERRVEIALKQLSKSIATGFDLKTNMVDLSVKSRWPDVAADIANRTIALVDTFNREQRVSRARSKRVFVEGRLDSAKSQLDLAEEKQRFFNEQNRRWASSPQLVFEEGKVRRDVDVATDLFLTLQRQFEAARLDEFNDAAVITVVDPARPQHKAQWPRYWVLLASALAVGAILGVIVAGAATILADWRQRNPNTAGAISKSMDALPFIGERRRRPRAS
jgi:uncharacterized protein involved in exopolysaccharide biosynthesis